jgi:hypothetical protein
MSAPSQLGEGFEVELLARDELVRLTPNTLPDHGYGETFWAQSHVTSAEGDWPEGRHNCPMTIRVADGRLMSDTSWPTEPYDFSS